jgi:serine phosphatase RsbU (regulator of sigma subunit)
LAVHLRRWLIALVVGGLMLPLLVAVTAVFSLDRVAENNNALGQVSRAQRFHQHADMMHDALRADVARARWAGIHPGSAQGVRRDTALHAEKFRRDLRSTASLQLPPDLAAGLTGLRPAQRDYIATAERAVSAALSPRGVAPPAPEGFEGKFRRLVREHAVLTSQLAGVSGRIQAESTRQETRERGVVLGASGIALIGWIVLVLAVWRSASRLREAQGREAHQRSTAELLQHSLLPEALPEVPRVQLAARYLPGQAGVQVGGDWYDVISLTNGQLGLVVGDVAGHDLPAATAMGQLRNAMRLCALDETSPAKVLTRVNRAVHQLAISELATCVYATLDTSTLTLTWCSAGHLPPLVLSRTGASWLPSDEPGPPLGAMPAAEYQDRELQLEPGDALLLYTDGLVERRGQSINDGLLALQQTQGPFADPQDMCAQVMDHVYVNADARRDDVTLLAAQTGA